MANPNRTFARFRPEPSAHTKAAMEEARRVRTESSPFVAVMKRVQAGEMTAEEGAAEVERLMKEGAR